MMKVRLTGTRKKVGVHDRCAILWCVTLSPIVSPSYIPKVELCFIRTNDSGIVWSTEAEAMAWRNPEQ